MTEFELLVDSTEQHRERPGEYKEQKKFDSGKKKKHTFKNQFIILPKVRDIVDVIVGRPGPSSDINLLREQPKKFGTTQKFKGDKAYIGEKNVVTGADAKNMDNPLRVVCWYKGRFIWLQGCPYFFRQYSFPDKKPKNRELSGTQKQENQLFSSSRILIEHLIRRVKVFQIAAQRFRLRPQTYQQVILIVCVPVRLRIGALILPA